MFTFTAGIFLAIFVVFVVVPLIVIGSVRLFLSILDDAPTNCGAPITKASFCWGIINTAIR